MAWPDVEALASSSILAVPVGSTEQHGPHLPLSTDTDIAVALATRLSEAIREVIVAPALPYGSSGEHAGFAGTLSIGRDALEMLLTELVRSADDFSAVVFVSAHGGNAVPVASAVSRLQKEGRKVVAWSPPSVDPCDSHAGRVETSVLLALGSPFVRPELAGSGVLQPLRELMPSLRSNGVASVSPSGVLGDPSGASAEYGAEVLESWVEQLVEMVRDL